MTTYTTRAVAMYMRAMKIDMKSRAVPKSFMNTSIASESPHITTSGPRYLGAGNGIPSTCRSGTERSTFLSSR